MIRYATQRIHDIANNLLQQHRAEGDIINISSEPLPLMSLLEDIVSEKRIQYSGEDTQIELDIREGSHDVFSKVNPVEFRRVISNLINNSIEAIGGPGGRIMILKKIMSLNNASQSILNFSQNQWWQ